MKLLKLYEWIIGTMSDFAKQFQENETLYNQARKFWSNLEASSIIIVGIFIVIYAVLDMISTFTIKRNVKIAFLFL